MPVLKNVKHEKFAQELAKGETHRDAYENAGFKRHESNYLRLTRDPKVRARIDEILGAAAHKAEVSIERVLKELALIGFANMGDYLRIGEDGEARLDMSELTSDHAAAIGEFVVEEYKEGRGPEARDVRRTRFKLSDKHAALVSIGKHLGMFKDKIEHSGAVSVNITGADADL